MDQVIRDFKPKYFMATGSSHTTKGYLKLLQTVKSEGITAVEPTRKPRKIELGSVTLTVLPQPPLTTDEENNNSIGVRLQYGKFAVLMTGDSETDERQWWLGTLSRPDLRLHDPQAGPSRQPQRHEPAPGSTWSSPSWPSPVWARATTTATRIPRRSRCSGENEIPLLRTDQRGTITIVSNGRTWNLVNSGLARRRGERSSEPVATAAGGDDSGSTRSSRSRTRRR